MKTRSLTFSVCKTIIYSLSIGVIIGVFLCISVIEAEGAPVYQNKSETKVGSNATSITISAPSGFSAGDLFIALIIKDDDTVINDHADWTVIQKGPDSDNKGCYLWTGYRIAQSGDTNWTWTGDSEEWYGVILRYKGHNASNPINISDKASATDGAPTAPDILTTVDGCMIIHAFGADDDDTPYTSPNGSMNERYNDVSSAGAGTCGGAGVDWLQTSQGQTGTGGFTMNATEEWVAVTIAIEPAADKIWDDGGTGSNWNTAANWSPDGVPGAGENVIFRGSVTTNGCTLDVDTVALGTFTVESDYTGTIDTSTYNITLIGNLLIQKGTLNASNASSDLDIDGNVTVSDGTLSAPNVADDTSFTVGGNWEISSNGIFTPNNSGRVVLEGASKTIITSSSGADDFQDLTVSGSYTLEDPLTLLQDLVVSGTLDANTSEDNNLTVTRHITISATGTYEARGSTITITGDGNLNIASAATFNYATSTVDLQGTSEIQTNSSNRTFYNLTCGASGKTTTLVAGSAWEVIDVTNTLQVGAGKLYNTGDQTVGVSGTGDVANFTGQIEVTQFYFDGTNNDMGGGDYTTSRIQPVSGTYVTLTGDVTASAQWAIGHWGDENTTTIVNLNGYDVTSSGDFDVGHDVGTNRVGQVTSGNILPNADFEEGTVGGDQVPDDWESYEADAGLYGIVDTQGRGKSFYADASTNWSNPSEGSNIHPLRTGLGDGHTHTNVEGGKNYTFQAYFKTDSDWNGEVTLSIQFLTGNGSDWNPIGDPADSHVEANVVYPSANQDWTLETVSATADATATHAQFAIEIYSEGSAGTIYIDDVWAGLTPTSVSNITAVNLRIYDRDNSGDKSYVDFSTYTDGFGRGAHTFSGNVTIDAAVSAAEAHLTLSNDTLNLAGNWVGDGTFTANQGTVNFNGSAAQTLTGTMTGAGKFYNLTVTNTGTPSDTVDVDPDAAVEVANTLTVTDGQFQPNTGSDFADVSIASAGILKPDSSASITVSGDWTNSSGTFTHNSGTVTLDGAAAQSITTGGSEWSTLTVTNASTVNFLDGFTTVNFNATTDGTTLKFKRQNDNLTDVFKITANDGLTINPGATNNITLDRYDGSGTDQWEIWPSGTAGWDVDYVTVSNSVNSNNTEIGTGTNLDNSTDSTNNTNWFSATLVDMVSVWAIGYFDKVEVTWKTASEINNAGFNIYRSTTANSGYIKINDELIPGLGSSVIGKEYRFWDYEVTNGVTYYYKLEDIEFDGTSTMHGPPVEAHPGLDSDGDGMTDDWENYYGLNLYLDDSQDDPDQDGLTNLEEFAAETDPIIKIETQAVAEGDSAQEPLRIIASNDYHIVMELVSASFDLEEKIGNGEIYQLITIPDYIHGYTSEIGEPQLPAKGVLVGVPQGASANIGGSDYSFREFKTTYNIYPVPEIIKVEGHLEEEFTIDQAAYSKDEYYPGNLVEVVYTGELRSQRVANIRFYPFQFNPHKSSLKFYERIRVEIVFGEESSSSSDTEIPGVAVPANDEPRLKLELKEEGIYKLTGYDLVDAGLSLFWIDPATVKLYNLGEEIPIKINGQDDGQFGLDDEIIFFAEALDTKYSGTNVYWLTYGGEAGLRMEESLGSEDDEPIIPDKFLFFSHYEEDKFYWTELEGGEDTNRWFFNTFIWGGREKDFNIDLTNIVSDDETSQARIKFTIHGFFDTRPYPNHHALIYLNDNLVEEALWSGQTEYTFERDDIPQSYLVDGTNTITVKALLAPGAAYDLILANYFEFEYWKNLVAEDNILRFNYEGEGTYLFEIPGFTSDDIKIFDITDKREVMYMGNFEINDAYTASFKDNLSGKKEYIVMAGDKMMTPESMELDEASNLRSTSNQADYIIITDKEFYYATLPLAYLRESLGLRTEVVKIDDIYDDFNFGIQSPYAIKDFLKFAYDNWQSPAPTYVLLVGDASYDYKDNLDKGKSSYVPTYLLWTPYMGETGSDNWFVCLDGEEDILPDMFIGRIPVRTYEEAQAVVAKIMDYEEKSGHEDWMEKAVIVADNESIFEETSDKLIGLLPRKFEASKLYIRDYPYPEVLTQNMVDEINEGALILNYVGHGSAELWADEQILDISAIDLFNNADRLPIVVSMTCLDGFYLHAQQYLCMAETFLKKEQGGAVAVWSPTGMGLPQGHQILNKGLFEAFFDDNNIIFGSATTQAKVSLFLQNGDRYKDLIHTYTLFGDPSLRLKIKKEKKPLPVVTLKKVETTFQIQVEEEEEVEEASGFEAILGDVIENYESAKDWRDEDKGAEGSYGLPEAFENEETGDEASPGPAIGAEGEDLLLGLEDKPKYKPVRLIGKLSKAKGEFGDDITNLQKSDKPEIIATEPSEENTLQIEQGDNNSPSEESLWLRIREALRKFFERLHSRLIRR